MRNFEHTTATNEGEAISLLRRSPDTQVIAGGTDLLVMMKEGLSRPRMLVDVKRLSGLHRLESSEDGLRIGALVTLSDLEESEAVRRGYRGLADAAALAASPQLRNMATVGGNLLQRPRCWYFRGGFDCWLAGGSRCYAVEGENQHHAIFGSGPCFAAHPSDLAPALIALGASVEIQGPEGSRSVSVEDFLRNPTDDRRVEHDLGPAELITGIAVPAQPEGARSVYLKAMEREAWSFALVSVAARLVLRDGVVSDASVVLGGVATTPWRARRAEESLKGGTLSREALEAAASLAVEGARPLGRNGYKVPLARNLVVRALEQLGR